MIFLRWAFEDALFQEAECSVALLRLAEFELLPVAEVLASRVPCENDVAEGRAHAIPYLALPFMVRHFRS